MEIPNVIKINFIRKTHWNLLLHLLIQADKKDPTKTLLHNYEMQEKNSLRRLLQTAFKKRTNKRLGYEEGKKLSLYNKRC